MKFFLNFQNFSIFVEKFLCLTKHNKKSIDERSIKKKRRKRKKCNDHRRVFPPSRFRGEKKKKRKNSLSQDENGDTKSWRFDRISWLQEMEQSSLVMRQSAFIIHRCGDGRRQIAGTKANVYGVFTSCTHLGRGVEEKPNRPVRYP